MLSKHNLSTDVIWTEADNALIDDQIQVTQPEYNADFAAWAGTSLLLKDQTGLSFVLNGKFAENAEVLYWNAADYAAVADAPVKGTQTGMLEKGSYDKNRDQAVATGISVRLSGVSQFYVRVYDPATGAYSAVRADSITANLTRMIDKYTGDAENAVKLDFARAYLLYIGAVADYRGTN